MCVCVCVCRLGHNGVSALSPPSYGKAAFCLEELMMSNPHNHLYCEQYAEVTCRHSRRCALCVVCVCVCVCLG